MKTNKIHKLAKEIQKNLIEKLQQRFEKNKQRHPKIKWENVEAKLIKAPEKLWSLNEMEITGGEPDVIAYDAQTDTYTFCDCATESPKERRSYCYDRAAWEKRRQHKPENTVMDVVAEMGVELLDETQYRELQKLGPFDLKTSSWLLTPASIRSLGGAIFGDYRYGTTFIYHNGADSYYAARGFRTLLKV